jgi:nucleoside 2-deoxyribosyltransferase
MRPVYLCGPINGRSDADCKDWREEAKRLLAPMPTLDPMARDYRGRELEPDIEAEIVENDKLDIGRCAALLVMFDKPSVGTAMEVLFAYERGMPVHVVDVSGKPLSPWLLYHASAVHPNLDAASCCLRRIFCFRSIK